MGGYAPPRGLSPGLEEGGQLHFPRQVVSKDYYLWEKIREKAQNCGSSIDRGELTLFSGGARLILAQF